jgi:putative peptidoglycan lipid II flippase
MTLNAYAPGPSLFPEPCKDAPPMPVPTPAAPIPDAVAAPAKDRFVGHANLMSGLTILSRVAGLVRDKVCSYYIGLSPEWSAFWMGFIFPNLFRRIFGEGALTAVFVPVYTETLHKQGREAANRLASATVTLLILVLAGITLLGEAVAIPVALSSAISGPNRLTAAMIAIMLPYCVMVCLVAIMGAMAAVHEKFTAQSLSPIILNLFMAGAVALCVALVTGSSMTQRVYWVAISVLLAGVVQIVQMLPTLWSSGVSLRPLMQFREAGIGEILKPLLPIILGYSAVQINTAMDSQIAWWLSSDGHGGRMAFVLFGHVFPVAMGAGAVAKLSAAQRIYMLPVGIFGVSMAMAIFTPMARAAAAADTSELKRLLVTGLKKTLFLSIPASLGMILIAKPLITLVYGGGKVGQEDIDRAYWASIFFCLGIWAFEAQMVILRVFFVLKDTRTPSKVAVGMIGLNLTLNLTLVWFLREGGIALATTIAAIVQGGILLLILRRRLGRLGVRSLVINAGKCLLMTAVMVEVGYLLTLLPMPWERGDAAMNAAALLHAKLLTALVKLPLLVAACGGVYVGLASFLKMPEVYEMPVVGRILRRT